MFDEPVGLLDYIVEVFAMPNVDVYARFIVVSLNRSGVGATLVNVEFRWRPKNPLQPNAETATVLDR
jgi:hypothetical protein